MYAKVLYSRSVTAYKSRLEVAKVPVPYVVVSIFCAVCVLCTFSYFSSVQVTEWPPIEE